MGKVSHLNLRDDEPTAFDGITMAGGFRGEPMDVWGRIHAGYVVLPEGSPSVRGECCRRLTIQTKDQ